MFQKPTVLEFTTAYPSYAAPEYQEKIAEVIDDSFALYAEQISALPLDLQSTAFKFAVCHDFALSCWADMGFSTPPQEISSRNDRVGFKTSVNGLNGTACGKKLLALFRKQNPGFVYASSISTPCRTGSCGGSILRSRSVY